MGEDHLIAQFATWLGTIGITAGAAFLAALGAFRWLGQRWLEGQFAKDLEAFKAEKNRELEELKGEYQRQTERLKSEIARLLDRAVKFNTKEYEVLPKAWELLNVAHSWVHTILSSLREAPDIFNMPSSHFDEFLEKVELRQVEKDELRDLHQNRDSSIGSAYGRMRDWRELNLAMKAVAEYQNSKSLE